MDITGDCGLASITAGILGAERDGDGNGDERGRGCPVIPATMSRQT
jgi:hypothetical protein